MTTARPVRHAVVIGAGPAGSAAAIVLARAGVRVDLVEKRAFPRTKVCGEFISPAGVPALESLVSPDELIAHGARRVDLFAIDRAGVDSIEWRTPASAWALSRSRLDHVLAQRAAGAGVSIHQPAGVTAVDWTGDRPEVRLRTGEQRTPDVVIHADGSGRHDPAGPTPTVDGLVGHKCHLRPPTPIQGVRMRPGADAYVGLIGVEDGLATCALVAGAHHIARHRGDADAMLADLWPEYDPEQREGRWLSCGVHRSGYRRPGHLRSFRVGNAAGAVDPVGGEGIGLALWAGTRLAKILALRPSWEPTVLHAVQRSFARAYRDRLRWRGPACRIAAEWLVRPGLVRATWPLAKRPSVLIRPWYRLSGKPVATITATG